MIISGTGVRVKYAEARPHGRESVYPYEAVTSPGGYCPLTAREVLALLHMNKEERGLLFVFLVCGSHILSALYDIASIVR